jgi:Sulfotransferase family
VRDNLSIPTFIIVGAARSGTTTAYEYLKIHPDVFMSPIKETNYFAGICPNFCGPGDEVLNVPVKNFREIDGSYRSAHVAYVGSWSEYKSLFALARGVLAKGEVSPSYLYYPGTARRIHNAVPNCKIVAVLRNPIERAFSNYRALVASGRETKDFESALKLETKRLNSGWEHFWALKGLGMYHKQLKEYFDTFPESQIFVTFYDTLNANPIEFWKELCNFVGIRYLAGSENMHYHSSPARSTSKNIMSIYNRTSALMPRTLSSFVSKVGVAILTKPVVINPETRRMLYAYFAEDLASLCLLLPRDKGIIEKWLEGSGRRPSQVPQVD